MAYEIPCFKMTLPASGDLSAKQYYFMKLDSSGEAATCTAATDKPIGILLNKPDAQYKTAEIGVIGIFKVSGDADLAKDDLIGTSADGQADAKTPGGDTTEYVVGRVISDNSAAAGLATVLINCCNPHRAA